MDCDFRIYCRYCKKELLGKGKSLYCNPQCRNAWYRGYNRRMQAEHRAEITAKLERLEELESRLAQT